MTPTPRRQSPVGIAEAFYGHVPAAIVDAVRERLPAQFIDVIDRFEEKFPRETHRADTDP